MPQTKSLTRTVLSISALGLLLAAGLLHAGPLLPPAGPVATSYKTLTEVEPRTAINLTNTPGDADSLFKITQPGSYYLTGNIQGVIGKHGIEIAASGVTIDLNGFDLAGVTRMGAFDGITTSLATGTSITVLNGTVRNWGGHGVNLSSGGVSLCRIEGVRASDCNNTGLSVGPHSVISDCAAMGNGSAGILALQSCTVNRCTAAANTSTGIAVTTGTAVTDCTASNNGATGIVASGASVTNCVASGNAADGIGANEGTVTSCTASANSTGIRGGFGALIIGCTVNTNTVDGISINDGGSVINCVARGNTSTNITCTNGCLIRGNTCFGTNFTPTATNLRVTGGQNRIEGNTCTGATGQGFSVGTPGNFLTGNILTGNTARANGTNWFITAGNVALVIDAPTTPAVISGNSGGVSPSTNPWANFTY